MSEASFVKPFDAKRASIVTSEYRNPAHNPQYPQITSSGFKQSSSAIFDLLLPRQNPEIHEHLLTKYNHTARIGRRLGSSGTRRKVTF
jgi:hypothetical protein